MCPSTCDACSTGAMKPAALLPLLLLLLPPAAWPGLPPRSPSPKTQWDSLWEQRLLRDGELRALHVAEPERLSTLSAISRQSGPEWSSPPSERAVGPPISLDLPLHLLRKLLHAERLDRARQRAVHNLMLMREAGK
uniref:urocortin-like n=1 Tax=Myxine glutinosa TaxID=7769 RepID=UPI00358DF3F1